jgi:hypothetical protein
MSTTKRSRNGSRSSKKKPVSRFTTPGQLVKVTWNDAWGAGGWTGQSTANKNHAPVKVEQWGVVILHNSTGISLASGVDENGNYLAQGFVPKGMIQEIRVIE